MFSGLMVKFCMMFFKTMMFKCVAFLVAKTPTVGWEPTTEQRDCPKN
jgi:hypothetical protein